jgi:hypothetical protein
MRDHEEQQVCIFAGLHEVTHGDDWGGDDDAGQVVIVEMISIDDLGDLSAFNLS